MTTFTSTLAVWFVNQIVKALRIPINEHRARLEYISGLRAAADFLEQHPSLVPSYRSVRSQYGWEHNEFPLPDGTILHSDSVRPLRLRLSLSYSNLIEKMDSDALLDFIAADMRPLFVELRAGASIGDVKKSINDWDYGLVREFTPMVKLEVTTPSELTCRMVDTDKVEYVEEVDTEDPDLVAAREALAKAEEAAKRRVAKVVKDKVCLSVTDRGK